MRSKLLSGWVVFSGIGLAFTVTTGFWNWVFSLFLSLALSLWFYLK